MTDDTLAPPPAAAPRPWHWTKRWGFRFLAAYFVLYTLPFPLSDLPWLRTELPSNEEIWEKLVGWMSTWLPMFDEPVTYRFTGSGDTSFHFAHLVTIFLMAVVVTVAWSLVDRRRASYPRAARWLEVAVGFYLGIMMLRYGWAKVIPNQFSTPSLVRLSGTYGDSSPMGILWTFMGLNPAYTIFAGLAEVAGGYLLFFRRTRTLGAAIVTGVMTNVVMMNFSFDVPVKLYSSHLLVMAVGLLLLDARRLLAVFLTDGPAPATPAPRREPLLRRRPLRLAAVAFGALLVVATTQRELDEGLEWYYGAGAGRPVSSLHGLYDVDDFTLGGEPRPPLLTDEIRWRRLVIERLLPVKLDVYDYEAPGQITVQQMDGSFTRHEATLDENALTLTVVRHDLLPDDASEEDRENAPRDVLRYEHPEVGTLLLSGTWQGEPVEIRLARVDPESLQLTGRGFRWINEVPWNR